MKLRRGTASNLLHTKLVQLRLELLELLRELVLALAPELRGLDLCRRLYTPKNRQSAFPPQDRVRET